MTKQIESVPEVEKISFTSHIISTGTRTTSWVNHKSTSDSILIQYASIGPEYLDLHDITITSGRGFSKESGTQNGEEVIINEKLLGLFGWEDPDSILGDYISLSPDLKLKVVGVMENVNYAKLRDPISGFLFRNTTDNFRYANLLLNSTDLETTMMKLDRAWKSVDQNVHPFTAELYSEQIKEAYSFFQMITRVIGFVAALAISIAALGLLGMTVYTSESRKKEIGIRKVMGASEWNLVALLSKGYIRMLLLASVFAATGIYFLFTKVLFPQMAYKAPLEILDFGFGVLLMLLLGFIMIGSQTVKTARTNPVNTLRNE